MHRKKTREDLLNPKEKSIMAEWYRMRSQTKAMAFIQKTIFSFEYASVAISALFYYQKTIQPKDPVLFYSITMGVIYLTASCSAVYGGRFVDRTGRLRVFSIFVSIFSIVGNIIYSVPYSKWFPILGRSLSGISDGVQPGIAGELSRCYKTNELPKILSNLQILGGVATILAPSSIVLFTKVNFHVFGLHVNEYNFIGLGMAIVMVLYAIGCFFFLADLTKHPGYHIFLTKIKKKGQFPGNQKVVQPVTNSLEALNNADIILVLATSFLFGFVFTESEITTNLVAMYKFKWSLSRLSIVSLCCAAIAVVFMKLVQCLKGILNIYFMFLMAIVMDSFSVCLQLLTIHAQFESKSVQVAVMFCFYVVNCVCGFNTNSWARYILFSLVPAHMASTVDGYRYLFEKIGLTLGFFLASYIFHDGVYGYLLIILMLMLAYVASLVRKKHIISISE